MDIILFFPPFWFQIYDSSGKVQGSSGKTWIPECQVWTFQVYIKNNNKILESHYRRVTTTNTICAQQPLVLKRSLGPSLQTFLKGSGNWPGEVPSQLLWGEVVSRCDNCCHCWGKGGRKKGPPLVLCNVGGRLERPPLSIWREVGRWSGEILPSLSGGTARYLGQWRQNKDKVMGTERQRNDKQGEGGKQGKYWCKWQTKRNRREWRNQRLCNGIALRSREINGGIVRKKGWEDWWKIGGSKLREGRLIEVGEIEWAGWFDW